MFTLRSKNKKPESTKEVLGVLKGLEEKIGALSGELEKIKQEHSSSLQKMGIVRFNPFSGVGGDQSFSIALLDKTNSGVVITSLYSQDGNRVYAKPIENTASSYSLSKEEKEAITKAIGS